MRYLRAADAWCDALPLGNGRLGAMVYGHTRVDRIQLNEDSLWYGAFRDRVNPNARENMEKVRALLRRGETLPLDDRDDAELAVALESELETRELMAQILALPPPDGELFLRRYVYGETAAQLGVHFNMPAATVRTRLHRARLALQKLLKEG